MEDGRRKVEKVEGGKGRWKEKMLGKVEFKKVELRKGGRRKRWKR